MAAKPGQHEPEKAEVVEELLDALDGALDRVKVLYEQYFLGIQKQPPTYLHTDVERKIRDITQLQVRNTALRYRFATLQQKFGSYNSYWRRTLRQIENGTYARNLSKLGRQAAKTGAALPEEILAAMPKRMREQVQRDREAALAVAKRRDQLPEDEMFSTLADGELEDAAAFIEEPTDVRNAVMDNGAHQISEADADFDVDAFFASVINDDDPPAARARRRSSRPPAGQRLGTAPPVPPAPRDEGSEPAIVIAAPVPTEPRVPSYEEMQAIPRRSTAAVPAMDPYAHVPKRTLAQPALNELGDVPRRTQAQPALSEFGDVPRRTQAQPALDLPAHDEQPRRATAAVPALDPYAHVPKRTQAQPALSEFGDVPRRTQAQPALSEFGDVPRRTQAQPALSEFGDVPKRTQAQPALSEFGDVPRRSTQAAAPLDLPHSQHNELPRRPTAALDPYAHVPRRTEASAPIDMAGVPKRRTEASAPFDMPTQAEADREAQERSQVGPLPSAPRIARPQAQAMRPLSMPAAKPATAASPPLAADGSTGVPRRAGTEPGAGRPAAPPPPPPPRVGKSATQAVEPSAPVPRAPTAAQPVMPGTLMSSSGATAAPSMGSGPVPSSGSVPNPAGIPRLSTGLAPSQATRPNPIAPGASTVRGMVPVESMSGPFPRIPQPPPSQPLPRVGNPATSAAPIAPIADDATTRNAIPQSSPPRPPARPATVASAPLQRPDPALASSGVRTPPARRAESPAAPPPGVSADEVQQLYHKYMQAKQTLGEGADPNAYGKLLKTIHAQAPKIMEQYKAKGVDFSVVVKDNQVVIRAKPKP